MPFESPSLQASALACRRGTRLLFKELSFELAAGQVMWVRGRNGRGKTSLLKLACGLTQPESGRISHTGALVHLGHANALKDDLTAAESLAFLLRLHGRAHDAIDVDAALHRLGVHGRRDAPVRTLSQGQRRRVALARLAAESAPSLWVLDEPFDALDADGLERVNALLDEHRRRGGCVLLSSHQGLDEQRLQVRAIDLDAHA